MRDLTESKLLELGFRKIIVPIEESGDKEYCYFELELNEYEYFISSTDDMMVDNTYEVNIFNSELGICYTEAEVRTLYKCLMRDDMSKIERL